MYSRELEIVSHETIYQHVRKDKKHGNKKLYTYLRGRGHHNKEKSFTNGHGNIKKHVDINKRSAIVDKKVHFDNLEIDTIIGKNHKDTLLT